MAKNNTITPFDLQISTGATISPFVWATKYALKHKGFEIDIGLRVLNPRPVLHVQHPPLYIESLGVASTS